MADKDARQKRYTEEFKLQAAKLIVEGGYTFTKASQQLGVRVPSGRGPAVLGECLQGLRTTAPQGPGGPDG